MKALEFLKKNQFLFQELIDAYSDSGDYDGDYDYESAIETLKELNESISELESSKKEIYKKQRDSNLYMQRLLRDLMNENEISYDVYTKRTSVLKKELDEILKKIELRATITIKEFMEKHKNTVSNLSYFGFTYYAIIEFNVKYIGINPQVEISGSSIYELDKIIENDYEKIKFSILEEHLNKINTLAMNQRVELHYLNKAYNKIIV